MSGRRHYGAIRRLPSGRFQARHRNSAGELVPAPRTSATKTEAQRYLSGVEAEQLRGSYLDSRGDRITVAEWAEEWLRTKRGQRANTLARDRVALSYLLPKYGHLKLQSISAVDKGLRDGLLLDLQRRVNLTPQDSSLADAALAMGRRFGFDEPHAQQSRRLSLTLFDALAPLHHLPASSRTVLEVAALLHDIGHAINPQKHHKHSAYLIQNADLPGITERERDVMAMVARFHRRTVPDRSHEALATMTISEVQTIRKLSTILRIADSLDRSHMQPVRDVRVMLKPGAVLVRLAAKGPLDLELWDVEKETPVFRRIFGRRIEFVVGRG